MILLGKGYLPADGVSSLLCILQEGERLFVINYAFCLTMLDINDSNLVENIMSRDTVE